MKYKKLNLILLIALLFVLSGCSISFSTGDNAGDNGGMFVSTLKGDKWVQKALIPTVTGKPKSMGAVNANILVMDPGDNKALYLGSVDNGLFYTYDKGENWQVSASLGKINVKAVAVDPSAKCTIYAASGNKVYKSTDCTRTWSQVYYDNDLLVSVNAITIDHYNSANVYIGVSRGDIIKSEDQGNSWRAINRFDDPVLKISISPLDSRIILAGTRGKGLFRSVDGGKTWAELKDKLKDFKDNDKFRDLAFSSMQKGFLILANNYGLIKSTDNGDTWANIELITPEKEAIINAVAISPKNDDEIYYITNTTFYRSTDGGKNWATVKLPTVRAGWNLIVDPENTNTIYMGVRGIKK